MEKLLIQANGKINLDFKVLNKREDGYHNIESTFQSINLSDFLIFEKFNSNELTGAEICPGSEDLIYQAKKLLEEKVGKKLPAKIHLQKTIPVAAGFGGGSADAAATLFGLNLIYNLDLSKEELAEIGVEIGADVPFFFYGGTCQVKGIGEKISKIKKKLPKFFVIFRPHKRVETEKVYNMYDETGERFPVIAEKICPEIGVLKKYFSKFDLEMKLTGSGPSVFCETDKYSIAKKVAGDYPEFNGDIFICHPQNKALKVL